MKVTAAARLDSSRVSISSTSSMLTIPTRFCWSSTSIRRRKRRALYTPIRPPIDPAGRWVLVVDDGLATGATMIAALHGLKARKPARLVCAVPVSAPDTLGKLVGMVDDVVCLDAPQRFYAVGQFYQDFPQVEDDEVIRILVPGGPLAGQSVGSVLSALPAACLTQRPLNTI